MTDKSQQNAIMSDADADAEIVAGHEELLTRTELTREQAKTNLIVHGVAFSETFFRAWLIKTLWNWFAPAPKLTGPRSFGLMLLVDMYRMQALNNPDTLNNPKNRTMEYRKMGLRASFYVLTLLFGAVAKRFVRN